MLARSQVQDALAAADGLLRLEPAWVPRTFMHPGRRLRLQPLDWDDVARGPDQLSAAVLFPPTRSWPNAISYARRAPGEGGGRNCEEITGVASVGTPTVLPEETRVGARLRPGRRWRGVGHRLLPGWRETDTG